MRRNILNVCTSFLLYFLLLYTTVFFLFDLGADAAARQLGWQGVDVNILAQRRDSLGLAGSWPQRYFEGLWKLLHGDFGKSLSGGWQVTPVFTRQIVSSLPLWLVTATGAILLPLCLAPFFCARSEPKLLGLGTRSLAFLGLAPQFLAVVIVYGIWSALLSPRIAPEYHNAGEFCAAALGAGIYPAALVFLAASNTARSLSRETFVTVYVAKGLSWWQIRLRILRNIWIGCRTIIYRALLSVFIGSDLQ